MTIVAQIKRSREKWNSIASILKREGGNEKTMEKLYLVIVQAVLLYRANSWKISKINWKRLESFNNRALRYMTNEHIKKHSDET